jgi:hypothetical protein
MKCDNQEFCYLPFPLGYASGSSDDGFILHSYHIAFNATLQLHMLEFVAFFGVFNEYMALSCEPKL